MARFVLLVRGVNVGAHNTLPMTALRSMLVEIGCLGVRTYLQSGNAVFASGLAEPAVRDAVEQRLEAYMQRPTPTVLRRSSELHATLAANPFQAEAAADPKRLAVTFLSHRFGPDVRPRLETAALGGERFHLGEREIYSWHPDGLGRSRLARTLGALPGPGTSTTRNWSTVTRLGELLDELEAGDAAS